MCSNQVEIDTQISQVNQKTKPSTKEWLAKLELICTFKNHNGGALISSNKYSEVLKQIIQAIVPQAERQWKKETFQWHIFKRNAVRQIQESLNENNIKFIIINLD
jgi:hypothetical protein